MQVEVLQRQLSQAMKLVQSRHLSSSLQEDGRGSGRRLMDCVERTSPSDDETRRQLENALNDAQQQLRAERERSEAAERQQAAAADRSTSVLADKEAALSQLRDRLMDVERQLTEQVDKNTNILDELNTCRADKIDLAQQLQLEKAKTSDLEADVEHLRADMADMTESRGLETTNRLLREDLERVESRLKVVQLDNSQFQETCSALQATIDALKTELETKTVALKQKDANIRNLEETTMTLQTEVSELKNSLTQAEDSAARTQTELEAVKCTLEDKLANVDHLKRKLNDETTKSQKLEKTVVDLYAELESKDLEFETEAKKSKVAMQQIETKLRVSEEDNAKLKDLLRDAEQQVKQLEEQLKTREKQLIETGSESMRDGSGPEMTDGLVVDEPGAEQTDGGRRPVAAVLGVSVSAGVPAAGNSMSPSDDDKLRERYAVAVRKIQSIQRDLRHAEARQAELQDKNALLRQQLTGADWSHDERTIQLTAKVNQLTVQLDTAQSRLLQLQVDLMQPWF